MREAMRASIVFNQLKFKVLLLIFVGMSIYESGCSTRTLNDKKSLPQKTLEQDPTREKNPEEQFQMEKKKQLDDQNFEEESSFDDHTFDEGVSKHQNGGGKVEPISDKSKSKQETSDTSTSKQKTFWDDPIKNKFPEAPFDLAEVDAVLNVAGGSGGYGDFTGPFFIFLELMEADTKRARKFYTWQEFVVIIDDYTYFEVLKKMYNFDDLRELNKRFNLHFVSLEQAKSIKSAKYIFEFFSGGRSPNFQTKHPFYNSRSIRIVSDPMHIRFAPLDFAETKSGRLLFFQPPGIGPRRSGLVLNPEISPYLNKSLSERRTEAIKRVPSGPLRDILSSNKFQDANFGFVYGAHNTVSRGSAVYLMKTTPELKVQTLKLLQDIKPVRSPDRPLIIFTPNSAEVFKLAFTNDVDVNTNRLINVKDALLNRFTPTARKPETRNFLENLDKFVEILTPSQLLAKDTLKKDLTYIVTTGGINSDTFVALMSVANTPLGIEGNSSVSAAIRLHEGFVMYLSMWNWESINDLIETEEQCPYTRSSHFRSIYEGNWKVPKFELFFNQFKTLDEEKNFMANFDRCVPNFTPKLELIMEAVNEAASIDALAETEKGELRETRYLSLSRRLLPHDVYLAYSLIYNAVQEFKIYPEALIEISKEIKSKYHMDEKDILDRMRAIYKTLHEISPSEKDLTRMVKRVQPETRLLLNSEGIDQNQANGDKCYYKNLLAQMSRNDSQQEEFFKIIENHLGRETNFSTYHTEECKIECSNLSINQVYESLLSKNILQDKELDKVFSNVMTKILTGLSSKLALADELRKKKVDIDHKKAFNEVVDQWISLGKSQLPGLQRETYWKSHVTQYHNKNSVLRETLGLDHDGNFVPTNRVNAAFQLDFLLEISKQTKKVVIPFWYQKERNIFFSSYERKVRGYRADKPEAERTIVRTQYGFVPFDVPQLESPKGSLAWQHWGRDICINDAQFSVYSRNVNALDIPMVCGISGTTNLVLWSLFASKVDLNEEEIRALLLLTWATLAVDGGHSLQEVLTASKLVASYVVLMAKHKTEFRNNISPLTLSSLDAATKDILAIDYNLNPNATKFKRIQDTILSEGKGPYYIDYWEDDKKHLTSKELEIQKEIEYYFNYVGKQSSDAKFGHYNDGFFKHIDSESFKNVRKHSQDELVEYYHSTCTPHRQY